MGLIVRYRTLIPAAALLTALTCFIPPFSTARTAAEADTADAASAVHRVMLKDGSQLVGIIVRQTPDSLTIRSAANLTFSVSRLQVAETEELNGGFVNGEYRRIDPNRSRLFFGPTALPVHGGYLADYEIFFPFLSFGIADVITISGGMTILPGATEQLYYFAPKISIPLGTQTVSLAAGFIYSNITGGFENEGAGIAYGVTTVGSGTASLTLGLGFGFAGGEFAGSPVVLLGGEARLSNSVALISENWIPTGGDGYLVSFGFRFFGDHLSADLGLLYPVSDSEPTGFPFIPWLGFCYNFGGGK